MDIVFLFHEAQNNNHRARYAWPPLDALVLAIRTPPPLNLAHPTLKLTALNAQD